MALSDTFTTLGNTIINLVNSRTEHKQNQLVAGDGIQITENTAEKNADICIHPDIEAAFQSVIDELNGEAGVLPENYPVILLEDIADGSVTPPEEPFIVSTNLTEIEKSYYAYQLLSNNTNLVSVNLNKLTYSLGNGLQEAFSGCTNLTSVDLSGLERAEEDVLSGAFRGCISLTSVNLSNLRDIDSRACLMSCFQDCTSLKTLSFPSLDARTIYQGHQQFDFMLDGCTDVEVHFPRDIEDMVNISGILENIGGTNITPVFDLPAVGVLLNFIFEDDNGKFVAVGKIGALGLFSQSVPPEKITYYSCSDLVNGFVLLGTTTTGTIGTTVNITPDFTQEGYTITLNVGTSGATASGVIADNDNLSEVQQIGHLMFVEKTPGVYQAKVIGDQGGMHFVYQIADETTGAVASNEDNPMVTTGEDITLDVTLTQVNSGS